METIICIRAPWSLELCSSLVHLMSTAGRGRASSDDDRHSDMSMTSVEFEKQKKDMARELAKLQKEAKRKQRQKVECLAG